MQNRHHRSFSSARVQPPVKNKAVIPLKPLLFIGLVFFVGVYVFTRGDAQPAATAEAAATTKAAERAAKKPEVAATPFPSLDSRLFTSTQQKMLSLMKQEYAKHPVSFDETILSYTEGFRESWCSDFISWVRFEAGKPFENPETGYWRIPGVQSLRDYYASTDAYHLVGAYTPKFGDVAFYFGETPDGTNREHVAFVLGVQGDVLLTLGGNETTKGILQIRSNKLIEGERGLSGFGESNL